MDEVEIVDYDPRWPLLFDEEAKRLRAVLDPSLIVGLEHFESDCMVLSGVGRDSASRSR
jgi:GrpB-like predicted nucleotidyltransferase (UPF0157 family)